jgi:hypothetical protein
MRTAQPNPLVRLVIVVVAFGVLLWMFLNAAGAARAGTNSNVPPVLVKMVNATYGPDPDGTHGSPDSIPPILARYSKVAAAFDARWTAFAARKAEVDKAIAAGDALAKAGKYDDAMTAVAAVITTIARDDAGQLPKKRDVLEVRDAELAAVFAWARYAEGKKDVSPAADIAAAMYVRRKTSDDKADEELLWFADAEAESLKFQNHSDKDPDEARVTKAMNDVQHLPEAGHSMAWGFYKSIESRFGYVKSAAEDSSKAKKGGGVLMDLAPTKIDDKSITLNETEEWNEPHDCVLTDKIDAIDPDTGKVTYKEQCQYKKVKRHTELRGTFAAPPPAWALHSDDALTIAAHVDAVGPKWVLSNVRVLDFRFIKGGADNNTANILDMMGQGDDEPDGE